MSKPNVHSVHRDWDRQFPLIERAEGIYLYDSEGRRYIDGSGGSSVVTAIGHGVGEVIEAMYRQAQQFSFSPMHAFTHQPLLELGELVVNLAPGELRNKSLAWFTCTGADATDDAARLARQYFVERGQSSRYLVIGRWQSFHGNNIAVAGFSGHVARRSIFQPMFVNSPHIPAAFCYRCYFEQTYPACELLCARALEREICCQGPENVAAFIAEPIVGAALGAVPAPDGYFQLIREICDRYGVLFIADEVMTGWGRSGRMWGIEHWEVTPDIVATAKGLTGGYTPLSAVIARDGIWETLRRNHSPFKAGHTFNANPVSCAGAIAAINYLLAHDLAENARLQGDYFLAGLQTLMDKHPIVGDVRGRGLMLGIELVKDRATREPFPPERRMSRVLERAALERGLVVYPCTGSLNGVAGDMIMLAPPLTISRAQVNDCLAILDGALQAVEHGLDVIP
jgi:adenosylmethionine-8-amino-7-oxononanoate aminotransferase